MSGQLLPAPTRPALDARGWNDCVVQAQSTEKAIQASFFKAPMRGYAEVSKTG